VVRRRGPSACTDVTARSWSQLQELLFSDTFDAGIDRFRGDLVYRGLPRSAYKLATTLMRLGGSYASLERHLLRNFRKYTHQTLTLRDSEWDWLALAQHYGLPTRLLDWTYSPLVALHFATASTADFDADGVVWKVNSAAAHRLLPTAAARSISRAGARVFTTELLEQAAADLQAFDALATRPFVAFLEPPSLDARIVNQYALFSVLSDPCLALDDWLTGKPELSHRIIVPARLKWEVRDKLDLSNVNERVLFPGLAGLCDMLRRHYSPKRVPGTEGRLGTHSSRD